MEEQFLSEIRKDPWAEHPRLVYADWLEEQGDPRGEYLRLELALLGLSEMDREFAELQARFEALMPQVDAGWLAKLKRPDPLPLDTDGFERVWSENPSRADNPGLLSLSKSKLVYLRPDLKPRNESPALSFTASYVYDHTMDIAEHIRQVDSRAAIVLSTRPLLVAAYTYELDCVAVLYFSAALVNFYGLKIGTRLISVNRYGQDAGNDLDLGPNSRLVWSNFYPIIGDFVSEDVARLSRRKAEISHYEWARTLWLGRKYLEDHPGVCRDGRPGYSHLCGGGTQLLEQHG